MTNKIDISIVAPVYNEEENLPILVPQIVDVIKPMGRSYEMIFVDDASTDRSRSVLREMVQASADPDARIQEELRRDGGGCGRVESGEGRCGGHPGR